MDAKVVEGAKVPRTRFVRYSESLSRYSEKGGREDGAQSTEVQSGSRVEGESAPRNNGDYPAGIRWIIRLKVGLCGIYALLIAGAAVAMMLPTELERGQLWSMALGLLVFGVFEGLEAWGLQRRALWGSYLTVGRTVLMLPGGIYMLLQQSDPLIEGILLLANVLMVLYLIRDLPRLRRF